MTLLIATSESTFLAGHMSEASNAIAEIQPIPLTVLIRTLNEGDRIGRTLASVKPLGAEIVVVDAGSKDNTVAVAEAHGARVLINPWPGFGPQRRFAEERCANNHIFSLDADEVLTPEIVAEIRTIFLAGNPPPLLNIRKWLIPPHWEKPPLWGFYHEYILIYDRRVARTAPNPNWDKLELTTQAKPVTVKNPLYHYSFRDWMHFSTKVNQIAKLAADTMPIRSRGLLTLRLFFEFPASFVKFYLFRRYALMGADGLTLSTISAYGRFIRVAMMLERANLEAKRRRQ
jgi:glycosyltransferase involved in cell wall biosynthesis